MKTLGIDYGRSKIGLAVGEGDFAEPFKVIHIKNVSEALEKVLQVLQVLQADRVVVGVSEMEMGIESVDFSNSLKSKLNIPVVTYDETLTSLDAQRMSIEAGIPRKKRHTMEDAYAASIMLQAYLDSQKHRV